MRLEIAEVGHSAGTLAGLPYDLRRKEVGGRAYLYEISDRRGNGTSLGPWLEAHEAKLAGIGARCASVAGISGPDWRR